MGGDPIIRPYDAVRECFERSIDDMRELLRPKKEVRD